VSILTGRTLREREERLAYVMIVPTAAIVFGLIIFPAFFSIWISFHQVDLGNLNDVFHTPFIGLDNYVKVWNDFAFKPGKLPPAIAEGEAGLFETIGLLFTKWNWGAAITSVLYSFVATVVTVLVGLVAALVLNQPMRGRGIVRGIFLFPYVAPIVSVTFIWQLVFSPTQSGVFNWLLMRIGLLGEPVTWLGTRGLALLMVIFFEAWRYFPFAMLMLLARLQAIDKTLYEAADVDGANTWQKFFAITLPELRYVMGTIFLLRLMWTFNKFDDIFLLTSGGFGTKVLPVLTYEFSFKLYDFGRGAATSMFLMVILVVFMFFYIRKVLEW
jgi:multiple sugar transport system permease protein